MPGTEVNRFGLRRNIPAEVKRQVRQRCAFGCTICGNPLVIYHHFDPPFRDATEHKASGITILCRSHAGEADNGLRSPDSIKEFDGDPYCRRVGSARTFFDLRTGPFTFRIGTATVKAPVILATEYEPIISIGDPEEVGSPYQLNAVLRDSSGRILFRIQDNELKIGIDRFDITMTGRRITIHEESRNIALIMNLVLNQEIHIERVSMPIHDCWLIAQEDYCELRSPTGGTLRCNGGFIGDIGIWICQSRRQVFCGALFPAGGAGVVMSMGPEASEIQHMIAEGSANVSIWENAVWCHLSSTLTAFFDKKRRSAVDC